MSLFRKLFISYLVVVMVGVFVLAVSTAFVAPATFASHMDTMMNSSASGMGSMMGGGPSTDLADLNASFRLSLNSALFIAAIAAMVAATAISWYVSRRIAQPIREMTRASQHIAEGHYDERLTVYEKDELGELMGSFNRMAGALAETETMRQQLIADVSHELKTPLASIQGYMEGLQDGVIASTPETFQLIYHEANRLQRLVHDLQELSRAEAAPLQLDLKPHPAWSIIDSVVSFLQPQFDEKGVALSLEAPDEPVNVRADFDRTRQVIINLLGNALQYTPENGRVTVHWTRNHTAVHFSVRDTGVGLAPPDVERVFQRFYRVDKSRSRASGGSGIGLTIARQLIEAQGGKIWAESQGVGQGSTFHFTLPLA
jgi:signal transduction histidine kinase